MANVFDLYNQLKSPQEGAPTLSNNPEMALGMVHPAGAAGGGGFGDPYNQGSGSSSDPSSIAKNGAYPAGDTGDNSSFSIGGGTSGSLDAISSAFV
jgi:hypothetical protein